MRYRILWLLRGCVMTHADSRDIQHFTDMFTPLEGETFECVEWDNGWEVLVLNFSNGFKVDIQSDAEGNAAGWPHVWKEYEGD